MYLIHIFDSCTVPVQYIWFMIIMCNVFASYTCIMYLIHLTDYLLMYLRNVFDCLLAWIPRAMSNNAPNLKQKLLQIQKKKTGQYSTDMLLSDMSSQHDFFRSRIWNEGTMKNKLFLHVRKLIFWLHTSFAHTIKHLLIFTFRIWFMPLLT